MISECLPFSFEKICYASTLYTHTNTTGVIFIYLFIIIFKMHNRSRSSSAQNLPVVPCFAQSRSQSLSNALRSLSSLTTSLVFLLSPLGPVKVPFQWSFLQSPPPDSFMELLSDLPFVCSCLSVRCLSGTFLDRFI